MLVRIASRIGIDRIPKDVTPTLATYLDRSDEKATETVEFGAAMNRSSQEPLPEVAVRAAG
jgi:hypothetical protein